MRGAGRDDRFVCANLHLVVLDQAARDVTSQVRELRPVHDRVARPKTCTKPPLKPASRDKPRVTARQNCTEMSPALGSTASIRLPTWRFVPEAFRAATLPRDIHRPPPGARLPPHVRAGQPHRRAPLIRPGCVRYRSHIRHTSPRGVLAPMRPLRDLTAEAAARGEAPNRPNAAAPRSCWSTRPTCSTTANSKQSEC